MLCAEYDYCVEQIFFLVLIFAFLRFLPLSAKKRFQLKKKKIIRKSLLHWRNYIHKHYNLIFFM